MSYVIVGLGNPGEEYENTRHNTGRIILEAFRVAEKFPEWKLDPKLKALVSSGQMPNVKGKLSLVLPETFMNKSGLSVAPLVKSVKAAEHLIVIHDDLDIPFGKYKISFNKSSGGHRGVESIIKAVKTEAFIRVRVGISPETASGKLKKPKGEEAVEKKILGKFSADEQATLKKLCKLTSESLKIIIEEGRDIAVSKQGSL